MDGENGNTRGETGSVRYEYDALDRIVRAVYGDGLEVHYEYDPAGNILSVRAENT